MKEPLLEKYAKENGPKFWAILFSTQRRFRQEERCRQLLDLTELFPGVQSRIFQTLIQVGSKQGVLHLLLI